MTIGTPTFVVAQERGDAGAADWQRRGNDSPRWDSERGCLERRRDDRGLCSDGPERGRTGNLPDHGARVGRQESLVIGIICSDADPTGIVSFNVRRDAPLGQEDHVRIVLGPFQDGRSGYVFAVNPSGARYDGVVNASGENENAEWDGYLGG